ncbi:hypothetical protein FF38_10077 [Lucilia cuprina]|uniref:Uncharacterized protein n=1 Tax=Lucilia cuprina TaxID=7375 RepID=A0A0L0CHN5_LUCCU|nr:hypothetical protein FF38_10077 [Lucilia cuprina]
MSTSFFMFNDDAVAEDNGNLAYFAIALDDVDSDSEAVMMMTADNLAAVYLTPPTYGLDSGYVKLWLNKLGRVRRRIFIPLVLKYAYSCLVCKKGEKLFIHLHLEVLSLQLYCQSFVISRKNTYKNIYHNDFMPFNRTYTGSRTTTAGIIATTMQNGGIWFITFGSVIRDGNFENIIQLFYELLNINLQIK